MRHAIERTSKQGYIEEIESSSMRYKIERCVLVLELDRPFAQRSSMPKVPKRRFQCHFPPLSNRSIFRGEALLTGIPLATRTAFSFEEEPAPQRSLPSAGDRSSRKLIPKPPGEVSRLSRGGYNLGETLGWSKEDYGAVRVCLTRFRIQLLSSKASATERLA